MSRNEPRGFVTTAILNTDADIARGVAWLVSADPGLARAAAATGPVRLRRRPPGFAAVLTTIMGQQVSVASATAIMQRLEDAGLTRQDRVRGCREDDLRACGLSRQKIRYALELAESGIDFDALPDLPDDQVIKTLTAVPGIGQWTAEIYVMFSLGRPDTFAAGDLALQEAARLTHDLPARPTEKALRQMAEAWAPWRTVAATLLWQYYAVVKSREGIST